MPECAPEHVREGTVEMSALLRREVVALSCPRKRVRERARAECEFEALGEAAPSRFEVGIAEPHEPRVVRRQLRDLF
jgi:hypothetical protein